MSIIFKALAIFTIPALALALISAPGCTSFRSTVVDRLGDDSLSPQFSDRTARGIPVKLKVPSHMEVKILETYFLGSERISKEVCQFSAGGKRILNVNTELIYTDKVFTVDFPRPLSGRLSLLSSGDGDGITFDSQQYFASIRGDYEEKTLNTINSIVGGAAEGRTTSSVELKTGGDADFQQLTRVVAFDRFDISECGWEQRMQEFVDRHLNACSQPCGVVNWQNDSASATVSEPANMDGT